MDKTSLGNRMKQYEYVSRNYLTRKTPVIIRLDGKAFHTFTQGMNKPFDDILNKTMMDTMLYLCKNIQGCKLGYTQSDEITLLLTDYDTLKTDAWFGYNIQKICSVSASMCTLAFNKFYKINVKNSDSMDTEYLFNMSSKIDNAMFDARVFSLPKEEVCNCFIWRQQDATRNSIQLVGQYYFSHKELHKKSTSDIQDMLMLQKNINWNDIPVKYKRGTCSNVKNGDWIIDNDIPIFTQDRNYVDRFVFL